MKLSKDKTQPSKHAVIVIGRFHPFLGGAELRIQRIAEALIAEYGWEITVLTPRFERGLPRREKVRGMLIQRLPWHPRFLFQIAARLWIWRHSRHISLVHTIRIDKYGAIGAWARQKLGLPHLADVITNELEKMERPGRLNRIRWRRILAGTDLVHCLNHAAVLLLTQHKMPDSRIWYRPNAVDTRLFTPAPVGLPAVEMVKVLCCGRLEKQKGSDILIEAWKRLPLALQKKAQLVLAGSGKWDEQIKAAAVGFDNVIFLGDVVREAMPELYRSAQIYIQPSRFEGLSNSILEAMASGLPVIGTEIAGTVEQVRQGENGRLVPVEDAPRLAEVLAELISDVEKRRRMGAASRRMIEAEFSMEGLLTDFAGKYDELHK